MPRNWSAETLSEYKQVCDMTHIMKVLTDFTVRSVRQLAFLIVYFRRPNILLAC